MRGRQHRRLPRAANTLAPLLVKNCTLYTIGYKRRINRSLRVVVAFEKPVGYVAVGFQRVSQRRQRLSCQVTSSFGYVKPDSVRGVDNRVTGRSCTSRVKKERNVTAFCPRAAYRFCLRIPGTRSCYDHAHHHCTSTTDIRLQICFVCNAFGFGGLDSQVGSVVGQSAKVTGSIPGGAKVLGTDGISKYLPVSVSSYVEVCLCLLCSVCIN